MRNLTLPLLAALALFGAGCAGGGASGGSSLGASRVGMFVTDDLTTQYDHVWVTVKKVELLGAGDPVVAFSDPAGKVVDVRSLNQAGVAHFSFLGLSDVPAAAYSQVRLTLDQSVTLVPAGATDGVTRTFAGAVGGNAVLTYALPQGKHLAGHDNLIADFDLAKWVDDGVHITGVVKHRENEGLDDEKRHEAAQAEGVVSNLAGTAPAQTFDLTGEHGAALHVALDANTAVLNSDGSANPVLANGERVRVRGAITAATQLLAATDVRVAKAQVQEQDNGEAHGMLASVRSDGLTLTLHSAEHFVPAGTSLNVSFNGQTLFFSADGVAMNATDFLAAAAQGAPVSVEGTYDAGGKVLAAHRVKLDRPEHGEGGGSGSGTGSGTGSGSGSGSGGDGGSTEQHKVEIHAVVTSFDAAAGTVNVEVASWQGIALQPGAKLKISTDANSLFGKRDARTTAAAFFANLATGMKVEANGVLSTSGLAATSMRRDD